MAQDDPPEDLQADLLRRGLMAPSGRFQPLLGGRTNRVWKLVGSGPDRVLKLYQRTIPNPLFGNDPALETLCLNALATTGLCPKFRASGEIPNAVWVLYEHAAGQTWANNSAPVARLLGQLHALKPPLALPIGCNGSADLEVTTRHILSLCHTVERARLLDLRPAGNVPPTQATCLIHGDPVAGNILVNGTSLVLIDWQCPAMGDAAEDLALFLSPAMMQVYRGAPLTPDETSTFLAAYPDQKTTARYEALRPWFTWRMAAYCLWRAENGSAEYALGLPFERALLEAG
ncbi:phosphotransferase [Ruegeria sp. 2012CJ41-6]|uniref:Phosphotransferase n=1 Tax=Ruegeria spongiae TaxID=2942209 RepID=A0ABT0Q493_9RHOB|nr:phosphotransferase [Ruegeria spongiae]MCL6284678.1 phosphotransferase [Ruegeria spongiae]